MSAAETARLKVPGATLHYEVRGSGPVLLLIGGVMMDSGLFGGIATALAGAYTVVTFDRRGNSRSALDGPPGDQRIEDNADDAHRLLAALLDDGRQAYVFGTSAGALIGLDLIARHPGQVRRLVAHEPPALALLPDRSRLRGLMRDIHATSVSDGVFPALDTFAASMGMPAGPPPIEMTPEVEAAMGRMGPNMEFFVGHEVVSFGDHEPDVAAIRRAAAHITPAAGRDSAGQVPHRGALALAGLLGTPAVMFPGDHGAFMIDPGPFAAALRAELVA